MTKFMRNGAAFFPTDDANMEVADRLPCGNYLIMQDPQRGLFFKQTDEFKNPNKVYGTILKDAQRIVDTYLDRSTNTGVMLAGNKGSGKTLLAREVAALCRDRGMPCIIVNAAWAGDHFNNLLQLVNQPCVVLFDEFEKVYEERQAQEAILTLLDGVFPGHKMFLFTVNDKWKVNENMRNRPGRIFYLMDFNGLEDQFIREYCADRGLNDVTTEQIVGLSQIIYEFSFDMLKALVEEIKRYGETPKDAIRMLNIKPEFSGEGLFDVTLLDHPEDRFPKLKVLNKVISCNPMRGHLNVMFAYEEPKGEEEEDENALSVFGGSREMLDLYFSPDGLVSMAKGRFVFRLEAYGITIALTKKTDGRRVECDY